MMPSFKDIQREAAFLLSRKAVIILIVVAFLLSAFSIITGLQDVAQQQQSIEQLIDADAKDRKEAQHKHNDYGSVAYYSFHFTYSPPSSLAFAAMGERDVFPWKHRIRMLALEGQIYENDVANPELSQAGRIDFAFIISVLSPLFIILLLHDLRASEKSAGRYDLLTVSANHPRQLWWARVFVLSALLAAAFILPFIIGVCVSGTPMSDWLPFAALCILYIAFWALICSWASRWRRAAPMIASALLGFWLVSSFIVPVAGDAVIEHQISAPSGGDILLVQREAVNDAWDIPVSDTFDAFLSNHPQWSDYVEMQSLFEWKWYYAFQQVGDEKASTLSQAYRTATVQKYQMAGWVSWFSPAMWLNRQLSHLAHTDTPAALDYQQQIRVFHHDLREFYYPLLFKKVAFDYQKLESLPQFSPSLNISETKQ